MTLRSVSALFRVITIVCDAQLRIKALLLEDWRMEKEELLKLDGEFIRWIAPRYRRKSLLALAAWFAQKEAL
ncbi:hypothetical protein AGMMS50293_23190 [Spirochaetia bacterium]|nr:hypothetical protein AGMMS50293_23190 [Spirochaetia bacterium]